MTTYCPKCKQTCSGIFCYSCGGKTVSASYKCPRCKGVITAFSKFCEHCGRPVQEYVTSVIKSNMEGGEKDGANSGADSGKGD